MGDEMGVLLAKLYDQWEVFNNIFYGTNNSHVLIVRIRTEYCTRSHSIYNYMMKWSWVEVLYETLGVDGMKACLCVITAVTQLEAGSHMSSDWKFKGNCITD